jgi:hypothetical protein
VDDVEVILSEREIRRVDVGEVMWVYELGIREICHDPCILSARIPLLKCLTHSVFSAAAAAARPPMP